MASLFTPQPLYRIPRSFTSNRRRLAQRCSVNPGNITYRRTFISSSISLQQSAAAAKEEDIPSNPASANPSQDLNTPIRGSKPRVRQNSDKRRAQFIADRNSRAIYEPRTPQPKPASINRTDLNAIIDSKSQSESQPRNSVETFNQDLRDIRNSPRFNARRSSVMHMDISTMNVAPGQDNPAIPILASTSEDVSAGAQALLTRAPPFRNSPSLGRTVLIDPTKRVDLSRALRKLQMDCAKEGVMRMVKEQKYHERKGIKRKRLRRERWRKRFAEAFRGAVNRIELLRRQGW